METVSSNTVPSPSNHIDRASAAATPLSDKTRELRDKFLASLVEKQIAYAKRHNTPFDGRKRNEKVAKMRRARKANKKRMLYIRYGV